MEIGVGLDATLRLSFEDEGNLARRAAQLGYTSVWTPDGQGYDGAQLCLLRWQATRDVVPEGLLTGTSVSPVGLYTPLGLAVRAGTLGAITGGHFVLGLGTGGIYRAAARRALGLRSSSAMAVMRDYFTALRRLLAGETVDYEGEAVTLIGQQLAINPPPRTPVYMAAMGPNMLRLAGEVADGVLLNWGSAESHEQNRALVAEGARAAGRDPALIPIVDYIRVCVDDDPKQARRRLAQAVLGYALGRGVMTETDRRFGYRAHFERMGFAEPLLALDAMRAGGTPDDTLLDAFPEELLNAVGYYGPADGALEAVRRIGRGTDIAIVRVVAAQRGIGAVEAVMEACAPGRS